MKNSLPLKNSGSLVNYLYGNNNIEPEVGKGATILHYSDRSAYEVIAYDREKRTCTIQRYQPKRIDNLGMSDCQTYEYKEFTEEKMDLVYRNGAWRSVGSRIVFTKEYMDAHEDEWLAKTLTDEQRQEIFQGEVWPQKVVPGITREKKSFNKVNIIFGVRDEYYDFSF